MGHKVNPHGARVGVIYDWSTRWYAGKKDFADNLVEDYKLRKMLKEKYYSTGISHIDIERTAQSMTVNIFTAKPGMIIGRGGAGIEELKKKNSELEATVWALAHPETGKSAEEVVSELEQYRRLPPFNIKLKDYGISVRAYNCCKAADIETIGDLCSKTRLQLMKLRNFGRKSFNELDGLLEKMNLCWGMWTDPDYDYRLMRRKKKDAGPDTTHHRREHQGCRPAENHDRGG